MIKEMLRKLDRNGEYSDVVELVLTYSNEYGSSSWVQTYPFKHMTDAKKAMKAMLKGERIEAEIKVRSR